jgi:hypothetical protein
MGDSGVGSALSLAHPRRPQPSALARQGGLLEPGVRRTRLRQGIEKTHKPDVIFLIYNDRATALGVARRLINKGGTTFFSTAN